MPNILRYALCIYLFAAAMHTWAQPAYRNSALPVDERVNDLMQRLTLEEKVQLLGYRNKAIERLGIPAYNWWSEGLHGVARAGEATVFPQAIGMAATFNADLVREIGTAISTEARAKHNLASARGERGMYVGLTYWSPNINIFRDPRWGRGQETYGEDPYLTGQIGMAYVNGMQGDVPGKLKIAAAAKHFAVHSGPESRRDTFNSVVSQADLHDTYLYAFGKLARGGVAGIMTAYNSVNGVPVSVNNTLLRNIVRNEWGYKGYIVTDCGALDDVFNTHKYLKDGVEAAAAAIKAGVNLDCSWVLQSDAIKAVQQGKLTEKELNAALRPLLLTQMRLSFYDDAATSPYSTYGPDSIHNAAHIALARKAACQSMVLLKNDHHVLPLNKDSINSIMVVGPNAASLDALVGNYHGVGPQMVNFVEGITAAVSKGARIEYDLGAADNDTSHFGGIWAAGNAEVTIAVIGTSPVAEGEAGDAFLSTCGGDRKTLSLPAGHIAFMRELRKAVKKPIIAVVTAGSAVDIEAIAPYADAVVLAWYPGEQGGNALADIVFGKVSPSGRLPITFYNSVADLPAFDNYSMQGRTYRYFMGRVQYPFGFGLGYTEFRYDHDGSAPEKRVYKDGDEVSMSCVVTNAGKMAADEVVQAYVKYPPVPGLPIKELKQTIRVTLAPGQDAKLMLKIPVEELRKWDGSKEASILYPGTYKLVVGRHSRDEAVTALFEIK